MTASFSAVWSRNVAVSVALAILGGATAGSQEPPTIEQSLEMVRVVAPQLSPTGDVVAYEQVRADWTLNRYVSEVWLGKPGVAGRRLSPAGDSASDPSWSSDGNRLGFIASGTRAGAGFKQPQIFAFDLSSKRSIQLTNEILGVTTFKWSPDGHEVAYVAEADPGSAMTRDKHEGAQMRLPEVRSDSRVWIIPAVGQPGHPRPVSPSGLIASELSWAPDGRSLAVVAQSASEPEFTPRTGVFIVGADGGGWRPLLLGKGIVHTPTWSPDGRQVAFLLTDQERYLHSNSKIVAVAATGGSSNVLDPGFDLDPNLDA